MGGTFASNKREELLEECFLNYWINLLALFCSSSSVVSRIYVKFSSDDVRQYRVILWFRILGNKTKTCTCRRGGHFDISKIGLILAMSNFIVLTTESWEVLNRKYVASEDTASPLTVTRAIRAIVIARLKGLSASAQALISYSNKQKLPRTGDQEATLIHPGFCWIFYVFAVYFSSLSPNWLRWNDFSEEWERMGHSCERSKCFPLQISWFVEVFLVDRSAQI